MRQFRREAKKLATATAPDPVLATMKTELNRAKESLAKSDPAPYFLSYTVYDQDQIMIAASYGGILSNSTNRRRSADVTMRVGTPQLDNTHGQSRASGVTSGTLPLDDDPDAEARELWELTDRAYKRAAPAYLNVKTNTAVQAEEEDKSPGFFEGCSASAFGREAEGAAIRPRNRGKTKCGDCRERFAIMRTCTIRRWCCRFRLPIPGW